MTAYLKAYDETTLSSKSIRDDSTPRADNIADTIDSYGPENGTKTVLNRVALKLNDVFSIGWAERIPEMRIGD
ncbi:MAG: hypothetical protein Kow0074_17020 [Candidatus Zixiibacteriota bacterium]